MVGEWRSAWGQRWFRIHFVVTMLVMLIIMNVIIRVMDHMETVPGAVINDPILPHLPVVDMTWPLTFLIYSSLGLLIWSNRKDPRAFLLACQTYSLMIFTRTITLYSFPLEAPVDIIPLADPVVMAKSEYGMVHTKDLFFSGHTATVFLCFLTTVNPKLRAWFLIASLLVGMFVLLQHVHYTIDVIAAPFITYMCHRLTLVVNEKLVPIGAQRSS